MPYIVPSTGGGGSGSAALSAITAAVASNTFANAVSSEQRWQFQMNAAAGVSFRFEEPDGSPSSGAGSTILEAATVAASVAIPFRVLNRTALALSFDPASGDAILGGGAATVALRFMEPASGANFSSFEAQAQAGNIVYILPAADAVGVLNSDGAGNLSWAAAGGGGTLTGPVTAPTTEIDSGDSPYTVVAGDFTILVDTSGGDVTVTLPAGPADGRWLNVKKITTDANDLTIDGNGNTIDGSATATTNSTTRPSFMLHFDDSLNDWKII